MKHKERTHRFSSRFTLLKAVEREDVGENVSVGGGGELSKRGCMFTISGFPTSER